MDSIARTITHFLPALDKQLDLFVLHNGGWTYLLLFVVVFLETGIVVLPFLPGDSLMFAASTLSARGTVNIFLIYLTFTSAAILGDTLNYFIGKTFGDKLLKKGIIKKDHIDKTQAFFKKHGGKTVLFARFFPVLRTCAPFIAGVGKMKYKKFMIFNVSGAAIIGAVLAIVGYVFGNNRFVKHNFGVVIAAMLAMSVITGIVAFIIKKLSGKNGETAEEPDAEQAGSGIEAEAAKGSGTSDVVDPQSEDAPCQ